jgi:hypothetical protein
MTDTAPQDLTTLEPLEPISAPAADAAAGPGTADAMLMAMRSGLPAPAYNPYCRDVSFYRFLFAGVVMFAGCMMPISADLLRSGYMTMSGGFYTLIAIAMIWSWWASIANNRPVGLKWLLFAAAPLIGSIMSLTSFDAAAAHEQALKAGWMEKNTDNWFTFSASWADMFKDMGGAIMKDAAAAVRVEGFWRLLGVGNVFVFLGALMAELGFLGGIVGGAKKNKAETKAKMQASAERKRK